MGYYINTTGSDFFLSRDKFDEAYKRMCELNKHDAWKNGGSYGHAGTDSRSPRPEGLDYHPSKWFSWMEADYPSKHKDLLSLLTAIGFEYGQDDDGNLVYLAYSDKAGQESLFMAAIASLVEKESTVDWVGEDGIHWRWFFDGMFLYTIDGEIVYTGQPEVIDCPMY